MGFKKNMFPKLARHFLRWFCDPKFLEEVEGDLEELFEENQHLFGHKRARRMYWMDVFKHIRPIFLKNRSAFFITQNNSTMWSNYLKMAFRSFRRSKSISFINVTGLALGLASALIVLFHVQDELTYDQFIENKDNTFLVVNYRADESSEQTSAGGPVPMGPALKEEIAGLKQVARMRGAYQPTISQGENSFLEMDFVFADPEAMEVMGFSLLSGNPQTALSEPNSIILTESMATKYFGTKDPMGQTLDYQSFTGGEQTFVVRGVMKDVPHNTHMEFDFLASMSTLPVSQNWGSFTSIWTYVVLEPEVSVGQVESLLVDFAQIHVPNWVSYFQEFKFQLLPITDIHLRSDLSTRMKPAGNKQSLYLFGGVGLVLLLLAGINFTNLSMANSLSRAKEIGVRKSIGAIRKQLVTQFLVQAAMTVMIALALAIAFVVLFLPIYNGMSGKSITGVDLVGNPSMWLLALVLVVAGLLSGLYPALSISRFQASVTTRGQSPTSIGKLYVQKGFLLFQFLVSSILIVCILVTQAQMRFIQNKDLGLNKDNVLVVPFGSNGDIVAEQMESLPEVQSVAISQRLPINEDNWDIRPMKSDRITQPIEVESCFLSAGFMDTYGLTLTNGRWFFDDKTGPFELVINRAAVQDFGWSSEEEALGQRIMWSESENLSGVVIGVVEDFHLSSFHSRIAPMVMFNHKPKEARFESYISIKHGEVDRADFLGRVESVWKQYNGDTAYDHFYIQDSFERLHAEDRRLQEIFNYFTWIAVLIACLGLFGLSLLAVRRRVKEIGIRKVLGASVMRLSRLLSSQFIGLIMVSFLLASPIAYYVMNEWLSGFSFRMEIGIGPFMTGFVIILLVAFLTMAFQTLRAAMTNPVDQLRSE